MEEIKFTKKDLLNSLIIGEISAWLIIALAGTLMPAATYAKYASVILYATPIIFPLLCLVALFVAYLIGKKIAIIYQIAKFVLTGGFNTLVDWGILALATYIFSRSFAIASTDTLFVIFSATVLYYSLFKAISFVLSAVNSFFWNKFWTFKRSANGSSGKEIIQFLVVTIIGFLINVAIASGIFKMVAPPASLNASQWGIIAAVMATVISMLWNFIGYKFIVFKEKIAPVPSFPQTPSQPVSPSSPEQQSSFSQRKIV